MAYYSWEYLRNAEEWTFVEAQKVAQTLLDAHLKGENLSLPEKDILYGFMRILKKEGSHDYAFDLRYLERFQEAVFHDTFRTHRYYKNLTGERKIQLLPMIRSFPLKEEMKILNDALNYWEQHLNDGNQNDPYYVRVRKDRRAIFKEIDNQRSCGLIGGRRSDYFKRYVKLLSYDNHIFVKALFQEEGGHVLTISKDFDRPVYLTKSAAIHILFTHYFPDLDEFRRGKSLFDARNSPYELSRDLRRLFQATSIVAKKDERNGLEKIDYEFKGRVIRCRLKSVGSGQQQAYHISTLHPLEIPVARKMFDEEATFIQDTDRIPNGDDFTRIMIHNKTK